MGAKMEIASMGNSSKKFPMKWSRNRMVAQKNHIEYVWLLVEMIQEVRRRWWWQTGSFQMSGGLRKHSGSLRSPLWPQAPGFPANPREPGEEKQSLCASNSHLPPLFHPEVPGRGGPQDLAALPLLLRAALPPGLLGVGGRLHELLRDFRLALWPPEGCLCQPCPWRPHSRCSRIRYWFPSGFPRRKSLRFWTEKIRWSLRSR